MLPPSSEDDAPILGPAISGEMLRRRREAQERQERENDERSLADVLAGLRARADAELAAWRALPCSGELEHVTRCADGYATGCERRNDPSCPRRQLVEAKRKADAERAIARKQAAERGMPERVLRHVYDRDALETAAVLRLREAFAATPRPDIVVLSGSPGVGKTTAAGAWCVRSGGRFTTISELARLDRYDDEKWRAVSRCRALVIDELGNEFLDGKGFLLGAIDALVNDRYAEQLPTVITTNLGVEEFRARYGDRVADRIREAGRFVVIAGESMRRKS